MKVQFDPRSIQPKDDFEIIYPDVRIIDNWRILTIKNGALMNSDWTAIVVSSHNIKVENINTNRIAQDGWELELKKGWKLVPSKRKGDHLVQKRN